MYMTAAKWLSAHWKSVLVHSLIVSAFLGYCIFLSDPIFDRFIAIEGEAELQKISLPAEKESIRCGIDGFDVGIHTIEVRGWGFIDGHSSDNSRTYLVLKSHDKCYVFDTMVELREDVTSAYGNPDLNLDRSGFVCNVPSRKIPTGEYVLGVYITDASVEAFQHTETVVASRQ